MPAPATTDEFLDLVRKSGVLDEKRLDAYLEKMRAALPAEPGKAAGFLVNDGLLTHFQAEQILLGKWRRFTIGKYKVLERLGSGGMGSVYLCEHKLMRRRVAVKVLPTQKAEDPSSLERFYREARAVAALDHPNIVRAYDIDQDEKLHFLVMEYVDGASLQEIIKRTGRPMEVNRAAHYMRQSALGLQHAHDTAGLVHRDIKPGNILVDRTGIVKVLDMGLARFFNDEEDILTKKYDENVLGTADYLAPEQALDSHGVDIRADIYSLGATFYFCLTGRTPFNEGSVAQKLIWHQTRQPKPIRTLRADVPEGLAAIVDRMMSKDPANRYQSPAEVFEALEPWTQTPIGPPPEEEMPRLSPAALGAAPASDGGPRSPAPTAGGGAPTSPSPRKSWQVPPSSAPKPPPPNPAPAARAPQAKPPAPALAPAPVPAPSPVQVVAPPAVQPVPAVRAKSPSTPASGTDPTRVTPGNGQAKVAAAPFVQPEPQEEDAPWEHLEADLEEPTVKTDGARSTEHKGPASARRRGKASPTASDRKRLWLLIGIGALVVVIGIALLTWWGLTTGGNKGEDDKPGNPKRQPLVVGKSGRYRTVLQALGVAHNGDRIVLQDEDHEEAPLKSLGENFKIKDITIEPAQGKRIVWRVPPAPPPNAPIDPNKPKPATDPILEFAETEGWQMRGAFVFDGRGQLDDLIRIRGRCPGLTVEGVRFQGFKRAAVRVMNCEGAEARPVLLADLRTDGAVPAEAGIAFEILPFLATRVTQYVTIRNCLFDGVKVQVQVPKPE